MQRLKEKANFVIVQMSESPGPKELLLPSRDSYGNREINDSEDTMATIAHLLEQLHAKMSSKNDKEVITSRLLSIAIAEKEVRTLIGSHVQAMPLFISILRNGTPVAKVNVCSTLSLLCKDEDVRLKVLLGGCVPPLLSLLKSESTEARKAAAEAIFEVSSGRLSDDHVGMKIFVTENVVPTLWEQLNLRSKQDKVVEGFVTGALRNLCGDKDGYWRATLEAGGVDIIVELLNSDNVATQSNAASLLARLILAFSDSIPKILASGAVRALLRLVDYTNNISIRASAADALEALSSTSTDAKKAVVEADGLPVLIGAIVAPSKECMQGESGQDLQKHALCALVNICDGMRALILYLGKLAQSTHLSAPVTDIIGALAYSLMVFEDTHDEEPLNAKEIEDLLIALLKPQDNELAQQWVLEAMSSLYGNLYLAKKLNQAEAKKVLIGLSTMAPPDEREFLILSLISLCSKGMSIWEAIGKREGIQLLISLLGLSSEQHQEYAVGLLFILTEQIDDSKWAITAAGGIPPLVQLLETGSHKAREKSAHVLRNLCCHSEDIRVCVESAGAIPAFLWLLKCGENKGQEASAKALIKLVRLADSATINELLALFLGESPISKVQIIRVFGHILSLASHNDLVHKGGMACKGMRSIVQVLNSSNEETQECAATVLADIFSKRQDICGSFATDEVVLAFMKLLSSNFQGIATQSARALGALSRQIDTKSRKTMSYIAEGDLKPLIMLAKTNSIDANETAISALANLLSDSKIAADALAEELVSSLIKVLGEGSLNGKKNASRAMHQLLKHFPVGDVFRGNGQCQFVVLSVLDSLNATDMDGTDALEALELLSLLAKAKQNLKFSFFAFSSLAEFPSTLDPLVCCLAQGPPLLQDKVIEILSRLCKDHPVLLGDLLVSKSGAINGLSMRITNSSSLEVRVGSVSLLICATKECKIQAMEALDGSGSLERLIYTLVDMIKCSSSCSSLEIEVRSKVFVDKSSYLEADKFDVDDPATIIEGTTALWLLSLISSFNRKNKIAVMGAGALEILSDKLVSHTSSAQADMEDAEGIWISALLLAILFEDENVVSSPMTMRIIPSLAHLLKSEEMTDKYFAAQAMSALVCKGNKGISLAIANSGAVSGLMSLIGCVESDFPNLVGICDDFSLSQSPDQVVLDHLFEIEDVRFGSTARKSIPLLVDLLKPMPDRPNAPFISVQLLTRLVNNSDSNKILMAEAGALEALTKYLSLSPQEFTEATITELLRILYSNPELIRHEAAFNSVNQLIAVLRLGSRKSRLSAARALAELFNADNIKHSEISNQAVQPLVNMLEAGSEAEQHVALRSLIKLTSEDSYRAGFLTDLEQNPLSSLLKILSSASSLEIKTKAAELCFIIFGNSKLREAEISFKCVDPLLLLIQSDNVNAVESGVCALERLLDNNRLVESLASEDVIDLLVSLVSGSNIRLIEASISALIKVGQDRTLCKLHMFKSGILENCLKLLPRSSSTLCSSIAELFRVLTNIGEISISSAASDIVNPLFGALFRSDISLLGQHSALQTLVNILEKPQSLALLELSPSQVIEPLIPFLLSSVQDIQQLSTELLSRLLELDHFKQDITTKNAVIPLVQLAGIGILNLQQTSIKALENISLSWPNAVADAGGVIELSKVIMQDDPQPSLELWESALLVLSNILRSDADYYYRVPIIVLIKMLHSARESTITIAIKALIVQERIDSSSAIEMAGAGAIDALLVVLRSHQCEEACGRLLETLFNNKRVREMKVAKYTIAPLAQYLLDPQTVSNSGRLFAALALGDLSQHEGLARATDSVSACHALISVLEDQPTEELKLVAICALQNFVMRSRTNRRAIAEAGGILVIQELLLAPNVEVAGQAASLIKYLFSNHTLQEYVSNELIRSLTAALEKELWSTGSINEEALKAIHVIFTNFPKLHVSEAATLCIPQLVTALKSDAETAQDSVLDILSLLKQSWSTMPIDISKSQAMIASEAVPILQMLMKTCPPSFHERADSLLHCLPGCLTVTVMRGNNLRHVMGGTNAFCRLTIGSGPPRQTKVVSNSTSPEWEEGFTWAFDVPPKGQKLHILCKSKSTFGKSNLGTITIQIDKVVSEGVYSGLFSLSHDRNKDSSSRTLEIEITWSNGLSLECE